jgi:hypothetical protein
MSTNLDNGCVVVFDSSVVNSHRATNQPGMAGDVRCASSMPERRAVAEVVRGVVLRCMRMCHEQISLRMHVAMLVKEEKGL